MQVVVDGLMTNYIKAGSGKKLIILLHGWGDSSKTFSQLIAKLSDEYTILAPDLPGFGGTQEPPRAWGVSEYAKFVADWLAKIKAVRPYAVIGHSNGGAIAIDLVGSKTLSPTKLVLLSSSGIRDIYKLRRAVLGSGAKLAKLPLKLLPRRAQSRIKRRAYSAIGSDYMLLPEMDSSFQKLIAQDMQAAATRITQPSLLVYGTHDEATPVKYGQLFKDAIPNSKLEILEAGHFIHQEQPTKVAELVGDFLGA